MAAEDQAQELLMRAGEAGVRIVVDCVCSIESGPCERVESLQMSGRF